LNKGDIDRMVQEAEKNADADRERKAVIEARNLADNLVYQAEKSLRDLGDKADATVRAEVESKIADVKQALEADDKARIVSTSEALQQAMMKLGQAAYQEQPQPGYTNGQGSNGSGKPTDENVVEGEFTEA
ncbi:MAG: Hsp70 family protein, partial [Anaerolineae bacterium]|nr:Hsp70 family protein [Anaerolineae bacterium]